MVKNRAKSGDFYWVPANVTPVLEDGRVAGYISIRARTSRARIVDAERAYALWRTRQAGQLALRDGEVVPHGPFPLLVELAHSIGGRVLGAVVAATLAMSYVGWLGFSGMAGSNAALRNVYAHDLIAVNQLCSVQDLIRDNRNLLAQLTISLGRGAKVDAVLADLEPRCMPISRKLIGSGRVARWAADP